MDSELFGEHVRMYLQRNDLQERRYLSVNVAVHDRDIVEHGPFKTSEKPRNIVLNAIG